MKKGLIKILFTWLAGMVYVTASAQFNNTPVIDDILLGNAITTNAELEVWADYFMQNPPNLPASNDLGWHPADQKVLKSDGRVVLRVNKAMEGIPLTAFSCKVTFNLTYYKWDPQAVPLANNEVITVNNVELTVDYNRAAGATYREEDIYLVQHAHYVKAHIVSVSNPSLAKYLDFQVEIEQERYHPVANTALAPNFASVSPAYNAATNEITLAFNPTPVAGFAVEYDLEWTFIEDYNETGTEVQHSSLSVTPEDFRYNSSRVTINTTQYVLNGIYEMGYLAYRVRAVGKDITSDGSNEIRRVECDWSTIQTIKISPSSGLSGLNEHLEQLNWQYVADYAEEGKKKEVITYFDGSLRSRQMVTQTYNANNEPRVVAQDKIYDYQGRLAIEVLPVPLSTPLLTYYGELHLNNATTPVPYTKADFDVDDAEECGVPGIEINQDGGASLYYSANNEFISSVETNFSNYVPVANGFPFVQTVYTPDNTGRVAAKSAPGLNHKIGSGAETRYAYLKPDQVELDRLFGSEAGYAEHYQKQVVIDANGQASVSYQNAKGQVVATALAGKASGNTLDNLPGYHSLETYNEATELVVDLMNNNDVLYQEDALVTTHRFYVAEQASYKFKYSMEAAQYANPGCVPETYCMDCVYDLEISLANECDVQYNPETPGQILVSRTIGDAVTLLNFNACTTPAASYTFAAESYTLDGNGFITVQLDPGVYTITKKLSVNRDALDTYTDLYMKQREASTDPNCKKLADFKLEAAALVDLSDCGLTCQSCWQKLGFTAEPTPSELNARRVDYIEEQMDKLVTAGGTPTEQDEEAAENAFNTLLEQCVDLCQEDRPDRCESVKQLLMADMKPGGQYAKYLLDAEAVAFSADDNNGADQFNVLGLHHETGEADDNLLSYQNIDEETGYPEFDEEEYGVYLEGSTSKTKVKDLTVDQFVKYFREDWLEILIRNHPEYCSYKKCVLDQQYYAYDQDMLNTLTYDEADSKGYLQPVTSSVTSADPFFTSSCGSEFLGGRPDNQDMWDRLNNYKQAPRYYTYQNIKDDIEVLEVDNSVAGRTDLQDARYPGTTFAYVNHPYPALDGDDVLVGWDKIGVLEKTDLGNGQWLIRIKRVNPLNTSEELKYNFSMKQIALVSVYCPDLGVGQTRRLYSCVTNAEEDLESACTDIKDRYWMNFRALYLANKGFIQHKIDKESTDPECGCNPVIPEERSRRIFPDLSEQNNIGMYERNGQLRDPRSLELSKTEQQAEEEEVMDGLATSCDTQCQLYADYWADKLKGCGLTPTEMETVIDAMIEVCKHGCDVNNPIGSSTVAPEYESTEPFLSFHDVLVNALGHDVYQAKICDELLIKSPKPYGHDYLAYLSPYADTCSCNEARYSYQGAGGGTCPEALNGVPLPECPCAETANIPAESKRMLLAGKGVDSRFACNRCIGCLDLRPAVIAFRERYPSLPSTDTSYHELLEVFLNNTLNMNVTYREYLELAAQCMGQSPLPNSEVLDETNEYLDLFIGFFTDVEVPYQPTGALLKPENLIMMQPSRIMMASGETNPVMNEQVLDIRNNSRANALNWKKDIQLSDYLNLVNAQEARTQEGYTQLTSVENKRFVSTRTLSATKPVVPHIAKVMDEVVYPPAYTPTPSGVDNCGCEKLLKVWQSNPGASDDELNTLFANKYNYGQKIPDFGKLKTMCCKAFAGQSIDLNQPLPNPIDLNPDDEDNNDVDGGCTPPAPDAEIVFGETAINALNASKSLNPNIRFPGSVLCEGTNTIKQVDICGCDRLIDLETAWNGAGNPGTFMAYIKSQVSGLTHEIPQLADILALCKQLKGEGNWDIDKVANLHQQTSNPLLKLPAILNCENQDPPEDPCPGCGGGGGGGGWVKPLPCRKSIQFSCSEFEDLMRSVFGLQYASNYNLAQMELFISSHLSQWNSELIPAFKDWVGWENSECELDISFNQDANQCGFPREEYSSFKIAQNASTDQITTILKQIAAYGCGCEAPPAWLQTAIRPNQPCQTCFGTTPQLAKVQTFLNDLVALNATTNTYNGITYNFNGFRYYGPRASIPSLDDIFGIDFPASSFVWDNKTPYMDHFYKLDIYGGGTTPQSSIILGFDNANPANRVYFIRSFSNIRPSCPNPDRYFDVDVELDVYDPYATSPQPQRVIRTIQGYMKIYPAVTPPPTTPGSGGEGPVVLTPVIQFIKEFSCCAKICNKPALPQLEEETCGAELQLAADLNAVYNYNTYLQSIREEFRRNYIAHCLAARNTEQFVMKYNSGEHHYTLYYYDQAGNLTQTVPPAGVNILTEATTPSLADVRAEREGYSQANDPLAPAHTLRTRYRYNSLNQLIWQSTPDAGITEFYYDKLGRIIFSQNARQKAQALLGSPKQVYSYTVYDALGRIKEVGEVASATYTMNHVKSRNSEDVGLLLAENRTQITRTFYDDVVNDAGINALFPQRNLRNRVSYSTYQHTPAMVDQEVYYTYDVHGNVSRMARQINSLAYGPVDQGFKTIDYEYDLVSGKVNQVTYQKGQADQYLHRYMYDRENRLSRVFTGHRSELLEVDAQYFYYLHGPLARVETGRQLVQGTDYIYTIQGWLKAVNGISLDSSRDVGRDGYYHPTAATLHTSFARDEYGFSLDYFNGDYTAANPDGAFSRFLGSHQAGSKMGDARHALFNGNISAMTTAIGRFMENGAAPLASVYTYDQLNRLVSANYYNNFSTATNQWLATGDVLPDYLNIFTYDANGNINHQMRNGNAAGGIDMDDLWYVYKPGTNQLIRVEEGVDNGAYPDDVDGQHNPSDPDHENYEYDEIGNLVKDKAEEIEQITWNVYGKITAIRRVSGSVKPDLEFEYTPDGHRSVKTVIPKAEGAYISHTYYMRDAQGNVISTYTQKTNKIIDYSRLTYADVNAKLTDLAGTTGFANFIATLHSGPVNNTAFNTAMYNAMITGGSLSSRLEEMNLASLLYGGSQAFIRWFLTQKEPEEVLRTIWLNNPNSSAGYDYLHSLCECNKGGKGTGISLFTAILGNPELTVPFLDALCLYDQEYGTTFAKDLKASVGIADNCPMDPTDVSMLETMLLDPLSPSYQDNLAMLINAANVLGIGPDNCAQVAILLIEMQKKAQTYSLPQLEDALYKIVAAMPHNNVQARIENACACGTFDMEALLQSQYGADFLRSLYVYDNAMYDNIAANAGLPAFKDLEFWLASNSLTTLLAELASNNVTGCTDEFKTILEYMSFYYPKSFDEFFSQGYLTVDYSEECVSQEAAYNCPDLFNYPNDILSYYSASEIWGYLYNLEDPEFYLDWYYNNNRYEFLRVAAKYYGTTVSAQQQASSLYGGTNGMYEYFTHIKNHFGTTLYNNMINHFMGLSNTYMDSIYLNEWMLYGSSRLGTSQPKTLMSAVKYDALAEGPYLSEQEYFENSPPYEASYTLLATRKTRGQKRYEFANHLGNVLVVTSDRKLPVFGKPEYSYTFTGTDEGFTSLNSSTVSVDGGTRLKAEGSLSLSGMQKNITTVAGNTYQVRFNIAMGNTLGVVARAKNGSTYIGTNAVATTANSFTYTFTATGTTTTLVFEKYSNVGTATYFYIDDVMVANQNEVNNYRADVITATDYSPFGAPLAGRSYNVQETLNKVLFSSADFTSGVDGWSTANANTSVANDAGRLRFQTTNTGAVQMVRWYNTSADKRYRLNIDVDATTLTDAVLEVIGYNNGNLVTIPLSAGYKHYQVDFLANISITLKVRLVSGSGTRTVYVDNVKLEELKGEWDAYRFGFNGQERDDEVSGAGNVYDYGFRIYNPRLGRFLSVDPLQFKFPDMSPYCYAANSPIAMIDAKGRNPVVIGTLIYEGVEIAIAVVASYFVAKEMHDVLMPAIHNTIPTYTKYSPGYDWQRRQEKAAERFNNAKDIAIKKMIDNHFNQDPDDPKNFNKFGKGLGLTLGGLALLNEVKTQLNEMKTELSQKADKTKNEMETIRAKGTQMTDNDKKKLSNLTKQYDNLNQNLQAVQDAMTQTDDLIEKEKQQQTMMSKVQGFAPADNTTVAPPVIKQP